MTGGIFPFSLNDVLSLNDLSFWWKSRKVATRRADTLTNEQKTYFTEEVGCLAV